MELGRLPLTIFICIGYFLDEYDLSSLAACNQHLNRVASHKRLWRDSLNKLFIPWGNQTLGMTAREIFLKAKQFQVRFDTNPKHRFAIAVMVRFKPDGGGSMYDLMDEEDEKKGDWSEEEEEDDEGVEETKGGERNSRRSRNSMLSSPTRRGRNPPPSSSSISQKFDEMKFLYGGDEEEIIPFGDNGVQLPMRGNTYFFDQIFDRNSTQEDVFNKAAFAPVDSMFRGVDSSIFVYGQSGSGKTHTMLGPPATHRSFHLTDENMGIIPRLFNLVFEVAEAAQNNPTDPLASFSIRVSYVEIYQDKMFDLLHGASRTNIILDSSSISRRRIWRRYKRSGRVVEVTPPASFTLCPSTEEDCNELEDVRRILILAQKGKHISSTSLNNDSSRGHSIFRLKLNQTSTNSETRVSHLYLADLAGSERIKRANITGHHLQETKSINSSLSALSRCIRSLAENSPHIPYRDSILTKLLQNAIGGNSRTTLLVTISSNPRNFEESHSAIKFGMNCALVQNVVQSNEVGGDEVDREIAKLRKNMRVLREVLEHIVHEKEKAALLDGSVMADRSKPIEEEHPTERNELYQRYLARLRELMDIKRNQMQARKKRGVNT